MFRRTEGKRLRLRPEATGPHGERLDDDWSIEIDPVREAATLTNIRTRLTVVVGFDHVHSFMSDPARGDDYGFLEMHTHVRVHRDGHITSEPMPPRAGTAPPLALLDPFVVYDGTAGRELTWRGRDEVDALPLAEDRQLMDTFRTICDALRMETGCEPQFDDPRRIGHPVVWELSPDHRTKHRLLGGMNGQRGTAVLVLTDRPAQGAAAGAPVVVAPQVSLAAARRLVTLRDSAIDNLLNRTITSAREQDELDSDRCTWKQQVAALMETAGSLPSEVSRVQRLGTFIPTNLPPLVLGVAAGDQLIIARNLKHRREMAERLDRLLDAIQKLEQRAGG
jgi:hypothetical protein